MCLFSQSFIFVIILPSSELKFNIGCGENVLTWASKFFTCIAFKVYQGNKHSGKWVLLCQIFWHTRLIRSWYHGCKLGRLKMSLYRLFILVILRCMCLMKLPVFIECGVKDFFFCGEATFISHKPETITAWVNWGVWMP